MSVAHAAPGSGLQVWLADLDTLAPALESADAFHHLLSSDERAWPDAAPAESRRHRRLARIALRIVLDRAGAPDARGVAFEIEAVGKPRLQSGALAFNASHTDGLALIAAAARGPLGVDLERERTVQLGERRKAMIVSAAQSLSSARNPTDFLAAWTSLEAFAKARGSGIGPLLTELGITASGARYHAAGDVELRARALVAASGLTVVPLPMPHGTFASLAGPREMVGAEVGVLTLAASDCELTSA